jgi:hypothetical protein
MGGTTETPGQSKDTSSKQRVFLTCLFVFLPALVLSALLLPMGGTIGNCIPIWTDEVHYWNEVAVFQGSGFRGGYTTVDEQAAPAGWCHFGPHGPGFPLIYGSLARLLGWQAWSGPLFNLLFLALASLVWARAVRYDVTILKFGCLFFATSWPLLLFIPSTMQETLHVAFALLIASAIQRRYLWTTFFLIVAASLIRVTWALVLIPWATLFIGRARKWDIVKLSVLIGSSILVLFLISRYICSPYPGPAADFFAHLAALGVGFERDLSQFAIPNLIKFPFEGNFGFLDEVQRVEMIDLIVVGLIFALYRKRPYLFVSVSLVCVLIPVAALYPNNSFRILYPHFLLACLVLIGSGRFEIVKILIIVHAVIGLRFVEKFREFHAPRVHATLAKAFDGIECLQYDPNAPDGYANTILVPLSVAKDSRWMLLPRGFGVSTALNGYGRDLKSKYIVLGSSEAPPGQLSGVRPSPETMKKLKLLCHTSVGDIYEKTD